MFLEGKMISFLIYAAVGALSGFLAGLLGIGGGVVIIPMLVFVFPLHGIPGEVIMPMALGTSMASITFTAISSFYSHHRRGAVRWDVVRLITPGIIVGTFCGAAVAARTSTENLKIIFILFLAWVIFRMLAGKEPKPNRELPGRGGILSVGTVIGVISSFAGIGGGSLSVPFMISCNVPLHQAIGTSAAIGFPIALSGAAGYILNGLGNDLLPGLALGYVYLPALLGIILASVLTAPLGVRLAHRLPVEKLRMVFALLLVVVAVKMALGIFGN